MAGTRALFAEGTPQVYIVLHPFPVGMTNVLNFLHTRTLLRESLSAHATVAISGLFI